MWLGSPSTAQAATSPPTARRAKYPCRPRRVASARAPTLALAHNGPDIGRGARPSAPHAHARLGCWTPRRVPCRGRAAGDVGPYHSPTRTRLAPTIVPPAPTSAPTILPPAPTRSRRWLYNGPVREVPAPPSARGVHSLPPYASTPRASRAPRNSSQKI